MQEWMKGHPGLFFGLVLVAIIGAVYFSQKGKVTAGSVTTAGTTGAAITDQSGLTNGLVYVPTSTTFSTSNIGADYSGDTALTSISGSGVSLNSPINNTTNTATSTTTSSVRTYTAAPPIVSTPLTPIPMPAPAPVVLPPVVAPPVVSGGSMTVYPAAIPQSVPIVYNTQAAMDAAIKSAAAVQANLPQNVAGNTQPGQPYVPVPVHSLGAWNAATGQYVGGY
jgi:hypothetical protein